MAEYHAKSNTHLSFEVTKEEKVIGKISYKNWLKFKAVLVIGDYKTYLVEPKGFWGTTIELKDGEQVLLKFNMNWNGDIVITSHFNGIAKDYIFRHKGFFRESFVLTDHEGIELLVIKPQIKWRQMNYEFKITTTDVFETNVNKNILLMNALLCANYYLSMSAQV